MSCVESSAPSSWVAWQSCENKSSPPPLARRTGICSEKYAMLLEIEQHQPARKQQAENPSPAERRGELLGLIEQHQLVGLRPEQDEACLAEQMAAIDQTVFF